MEGFSNLVNIFIIGVLVFLFEGIIAQHPPPGLGMK
jgi:hypothetical protein